MAKKLIGIAVMAIMLFGILGLTGCSNGKTFEVDGWTLFRYNGNMDAWADKKGQVNIISVNSESLVVDGVLTIPAKIGKYDIHGFGKTGYMVGMGDTYFSIAENLDVKRIVLAAELHVNYFFWRFLSWHYQNGNLKYVEFLSNTFERISSLGGGGEIIYIIPDGSRETLYAMTGGFIETQIIYEKSEWLAIEN